MKVGYYGIKKSGKLLCVLLVLLIIISGCGNSTPESQPTGPNEEIVNEDTNGKYYNLSIGTASATGTYYPIGAAISELVPRMNPNLYATAQVSGGSIENIKLVSNKDVDIGFANQMHFKLAQTGKAPFSNIIDNCRSLIILNGKDYIMKHALQFAVKADSDIYSVNDFIGRNVSVGPAGSGAEVYVNQVLESAGISYDDFNVSYLSYEEQATAMQDGNIEVASYYSAVPTGGVEQLAANNKIRLISLEDELIEKCINDWGYKTQVIKSGSYSWQNEDVNTVVADFHCIFVHQDMEEELAYELTKICMDNIEELWDSNPGMNNVDITGINGLSAPYLHPGAIRYYKEMGIELPDNAFPPEYSNN